MKARAFTSKQSSSRSRWSSALRYAMLLLLVGVASGARNSAAGATVSKAQQPPFVSTDAAAHTKALTVPFSSFASDEAKTAYAKLFAEEHHAPAADADIAVRRAYYDRFNSALARRAEEIYPVRIESKMLAGVKVEVITPKQGVAARERDRVLINLHGGAFLWGEGSGGEVESIPIASEIESIPIASVGRIT